jgi:predicted CXXCH cytochrome family protein
MKISNITITILLVMITMQQSAAGSIVGSPHDLSALGTGDVCGFCHTPHRALPQTPGWSHKLSTAVYTIYQSSSLEAQVGQPTGSSKLCLSCHDGTVALTESITGGPAGGTYIEPGSANLDTDLSDDHPISFVYSSALSAEDPQIRVPLTLPDQIKLDGAGELQCTTCHDSHDNSYGNFLVMSNQRSAMCVVCHNLSGWELSSHESSAALSSLANDPYLQGSEYTTVMDNGCLCCHRPHSAGGKERLLHFEKSEDNCLSCHDGSVAGTNIKAQISKSSSHDVVAYTNVHDIRESPTTSARHVECVDCHNSHAVQATSAQAPLIPGSMQKVSGVTASGLATEQAQYEYEVCFKCHADNPNRIQSNITRQITQTNTRLEFDPSGPSFHPVISQGVNRNVPSLISPWSVTSQIYCTDCHSSNNTTGAQGPHGSDYSPLLSLNYTTSDSTSESEFAYALCYKCHSRINIDSDASFTKHHEHIRGERIPCSACHDPHGISSAQGTSTNNSHLINFDTSIVSPDTSTGRLEFEDLGTFHGRCYLRCHGESHSPEQY